MTKSVAVNTEKLRQLAADSGDKKLQRHLLDLNEQLLSEVISVLEAFDTATKLLSVDKSPSLHLAIATKPQL